MIQAREIFVEKLKEEARTFRARFFDGEEEVAGDIRSLTVNKGSCGAESFALGSVYAPFIECVIDNCTGQLENSELLLQIGIMTNDNLADPQFDYIDIGYFTVSKPATSARRCTFTAYGRLSARCGGLYDTNLSFPASVQAVVNDIAVKTGLTISVKGSLDLSGQIEKKPVGLKYYEVLQLVAGLVGGYVTEDNAGGIVLAGYTETVTAEFGADHVGATPTFHDYSYTLDGIKCVITGEGTGEDDEEIEEQAFTWGTGRFQYQNEYMTQLLFDKMTAVAGGYTYHPGNISIAKGDPRLEPWDVVRYTDINGNTFDVPCMALSFYYDGGISCALSAPGESDTENDANFSGLLTRLVERTVSDLVIAKQILATKVTAQELEAESAVLKNAVIGSGSADTFDVAKLAFDTAAGKSFTAEEIRTLDLAFTQATGGSLSLDNLDAAIGTFKTLITGSFTADQVSAASAIFESSVIRQLYVDYLNAGYAKIDFANVDTATISQAWIQDLFVQGGFVADHGTFFELVGVKIDGDLITANTVKAEALLLRGEDGLYYKLNVDALGQATADTDPKYQEGIDGKVIIAHSITANEITTQNIQGTGGWINFASGTFAYVNAQSGHGIVWDGSELTISTDRMTIGELDLSDAIHSALDAAEATLIYDHDYVVSNGIATFTAHLYRGGVDVSQTDFEPRDFSWYYKTEDNEQRQPLNKNLVDGQYVNYGYTISVPISEMGYGGHIIGVFSSNEDSQLLDEDDNTITDSSNHPVSGRTPSGETIRISDMSVATVIYPSDKLLVSGTEDEHLVSVQTLQDYLFSVIDKQVLFNTTAGWNIQPTLQSAPETIYIYTDHDVDSDGNYIAGIKVGDGNAYLIDLPFTDTKIIEHMNDTTIHITSAERTFWNNKVRCYYTGTEELVFTTA